MFLATRILRQIRMVVKRAEWHAWRGLDAIARGLLRLTSRRLAGGVRYRRPVHSEAYKKGSLVPLKWWISTADRN